MLLRLAPIVLSILWSGIYSSTSNSALCPLQACLHAQLFKFDFKVLHLKVQHQRESLPIQRGFLPQAIVCSAVQQGFRRTMC